jgi:hypothetical protein
MLTYGFGRHVVLIYLTYGKQVLVHVTEWEIYNRHFAVLFSGTLELIHQRVRQQMCTDFGNFFLCKSIIPL